MHAYTNGAIKFLDNCKQKFLDMHLKVSPSKANNSPGDFELLPITRSRTGTQALRMPGTKVLSVESVKYWTIIGGFCKIRALWAKEDIHAPLCRTRGEVYIEDLVVDNRAVVLKNLGSRYAVEVEDFCGNNKLSTFTLIFTKFESKGFFFTTM